MILTFLITGGSQYAGNYDYKIPQFYKTRTQRINLGLIIEAPFLHQIRKPKSSRAYSREVKNMGKKNWTYHYNSAGFLHKTIHISFEGDGRIQTTIKYHYDKQGRLLSIFKKNSYGGIHKTFYQYNSNKQIISNNTIYTSANGKSSKSKYTNSYKYNSKGQLTFIYKKSPINKSYLISKIFYNKIGLPSKIKTVRDIKFSYNSKEELIKINWGGLYIFEYQY